MALGPTSLAAKVGDIGFLPNQALINSARDGSIRCGPFLVADNSVLFPEGRED
jgi:hypothetical protein